MHRRPDQPEARQHVVDDAVLGREQIHIMMYDEANAACAKLKTPEQATEDLQKKAMQFMTRRGYLR